MNIRAKVRQRDLIDQAAARQGRSRSDFMLAASCKAAEDVLLDQTFFGLSEDRFAEFQALLDTPPVVSPRLLRTLSAKAPWDKKR
ncbi:MAG: DUF1778 domain-containing protein [Alcaligenaceae bacterium]|nr:DUF1778 domain-containing protein [Alcaligenaceae bacterium]